MAGRLNLFRVKLNQRIAPAHLLSFLHEKPEAIAIHIYRIDAHMNQKLQAIRKGQAAGVAAFFHDYGY